MATIRQLVSSVDIQLKQTGDDSTVPKNQLYLWATYFINKYISMKYQTIDSGAYMVIFPSVAVIKALTDTTPDIIAGEKYSLLPRPVFDFEHDSGIYVSYKRSDYPDNVDLGYIGRFTRTTIAGARRLYYSKYEKPSVANPYWYRHGNYIGYLGIESINIPYVEMSLVTSFDPFTNHSIDAHLDILNEFGDDIHRDIFEMGRFALLMPEDNINDAAWTGQPEQVPRSRATSINQDVNQQQ